MRFRRQILLMLVTGLAPNLQAADTSVPEELLSLDLIQLQKVRVVTTAAELNPAAPFFIFYRNMNHTGVNRKSPPAHQPGPALSDLLEQDKTYLTPDKPGRTLATLVCTADTAR